MTGRRNENAGMVDVDMSLLDSDINLVLHEVCGRLRLAIHERHRQLKRIHKHGSVELKCYENAFELIMSDITTIEEND